MGSKKLDQIMGSLLVHGMPGDVRKALYTDAQFCADVGIQTTASFPLGKDVSVESASLLRAVGAAIDGRKIARLRLPNGKEIRARLSVNKGNKAVIHLGEHVYVFDDAGLLTANRARRRKALARSLQDRPLLEDEEARWRELAADRAFNKDEFVELMRSLERTPEGIIKTVRATRQLSVDVLMPLDQKYYFRLLAPVPDASEDIKSYKAKQLANARRHLLDTNLAAGLRRIAYSNLWQPLLPLDELKPVTHAHISALLDAFDPFSLLFGFELCRARLDHGKSYVALGADFLKALFDNEEELRRRCQIFTACAIVAIVTLRRTFDEYSVPLYWFRLAALTHAGLLTEGLRGLAQPSDFYEWARKSVGPSFLWHATYDRRDAPRWRPEWISPEQIEAELFGRVLASLGALPKGQYPEPWREIIDAFLAKLTTRGDAINAHLPGPLDDFGDNPPVPPELQKVIDETEKRLEKATKASDATGLTGLAYLTRPTNKTMEELTRLLNAPNTEVLDAEFLDTCAHMAACGRSEPLARSVINQCLRATRSSSSEKRAADFYARIVEACAAQADPKAYREFLAQNSTAFVLNIPEAIPMIGIRTILDALSHRDPKLFSSLSRASANLEAVEMRRQ